MHTRSTDQTSLSIRAMLYVLYKLIWYIMPKSATGSWSICPSSCR